MYKFIDRISTIVFRSFYKGGRLYLGPKTLDWSLGGMAIRESLHDALQCGDSHIIVKPTYLYTYSVSSPVLNLWFHLQAHL